MNETLQKLHSLFCKLTGQELRFMLHERAWYEFHHVGFTEQDLTAVVNHLKRQNRNNNFKYSLNIRSLIYGLEKFDSILGEAKAFERNRKKPLTNRQEVLDAWGKPQETNPGTSRHISEFIRIPTN